MAISHKDHDHPNTPAARGACRKSMAKDTGDRKVPNSPGSPAEAYAKRANLTVVPRTRGDGGVVKALKRSNTLIKNTSDMADMPQMLGYAVRLAWEEDWDVRVGDRFNEDEARITIQGDKGEISLVWKAIRPHGIWKIWLRNWDSSKQYTVESAQAAISAMRHDSEVWDQYGNMIG